MNATRKLTAVIACIACVQMVSPWATGASPTGSRGAAGRPTNCSPPSDPWRFDRLFSQAQAVDTRSTTLACAPVTLKALPRKPGQYAPLTVGFGRTDAFGFIWVAPARAGRVLESPAYSDPMGAVTLAAYVRGRVQLTLPEYFPGRAFRVPVPRRFDGRSGGAGGARTTLFSASTRVVLRAVPIHAAAWPSRVAYPAIGSGMIDGRSILARFGACSAGVCAPLRGVEDNPAFETESGALRIRVERVRDPGHARTEEAQSFTTSLRMRPYADPVLQQQRLTGPDGAPLADASLLVRAEPQFTNLWPYSERSPVLARCRTTAAGTPDCRLALAKVEGRAAFSALGTLTFDVLYRDRAGLQFGARVHEYISSTGYPLVMSPTGLRSSPGVGGSAFVVRAIPVNFTVGTLKQYPVIAWGEGIPRGPFAVAANPGNLLNDAAFSVGDRLRAGVYITTAVPGAGRSRLWATGSLFFAPRAERIMARLRVPPKDVGEPMLARIEPVDPATWRGDLYPPVGAGDVGSTGTPVMTPELARFAGNAAFETANHVMTLDLYRRDPARGWVFVSRVHYLLDGTADPSLGSLRPNLRRAIPGTRVPVTVRVMEPENNRPGPIVGEGTLMPGGRISAAVDTAAIPSNGQSAAASDRAADPGLRIATGSVRLGVYYYDRAGQQRLAAVSTRELIPGGDLLAWPRLSSREMERSRKGTGVGAAMHVVLKVAPLTAGLSSFDPVAAPTVGAALADLGGRIEPVLNIAGVSHDSRFESASSVINVGIFLRAKDSDRMQAPALRYLRTVSEYVGPAAAPTSLDCNAGHPMGSIGCIVDATQTPNGAALSVGCFYHAGESTMGFTPSSGGTCTPDPPSYINNNWNPALETTVLDPGPTQFADAVMVNLHMNTMMCAAPQGANLCPAPPGGHVDWTTGPGLAAVNAVKNIVAAGKNVVLTLTFQTEDSCSVACGAVGAITGSHVLSSCASAKCYGKCPAPSSVSKPFYLSLHLTGLSYGAASKLVGDLHSRNPATDPETMDLIGGTRPQRSLVCTVSIKPKLPKQAPQAPPVYSADVTVAPLSAATPETLTTAPSTRDTEATWGCDGPRDMPLWLFSELAPDPTKNGAVGAVCDGSGNYVPNYWDPRFEAAWLSFVTDVGQEAQQQGWPVYYVRPAVGLGDEGFPYLGPGIDLGGGGVGPNPLIPQLQSWSPAVSPVVQDSGSPVCPSSNGAAPVPYSSDLSTDFVSGTYVTNDATSITLSTPSGNMRIPFWITSFGTPPKSSFNTEFTDARGYDSSLATLTSSGPPQLYVRLDPATGDALSVSLTPIYQNFEAWQQCMLWQYRYAFGGSTPVMYPVSELDFGGHKSLYVCRADDFACPTGEWALSQGFAVGQNGLSPFWGLSGSPPASCAKQKNNKCRVWGPDIPGFYGTQFANVGFVTGAKRGFGAPMMNGWCQQPGSCASPQALLRDANADVMWQIADYALRNNLTEPPALELQTVSSETQSCSGHSCRPWGYCDPANPTCVPATSAHNGQVCANDVGETLLYMAQHDFPFYPNRDYPLTGAEGTGSPAYPSAPELSTLEIYYSDMDYALSSYESGPAPSVRDPNLGDVFNTWKATAPYTTTRDGGGGPPGFADLTNHNPPTATKNPGYGCPGMLQQGN